MYKGKRSSDAISQGDGVAASCILTFTDTWRILITIIPIAVGSAPTCVRCTDSLLIRINHGSYRHIVPPHILGFSMIYYFFCLRVWLVKLCTQGVSFSHEGLLHVWSDWRIISPPHCPLYQFFSPGPSHCSLDPLKPQPSPLARSIKYLFKPLIADPHLSRASSPHWQSPQYMNNFLLHRAPIRSPMPPIRSNCHRCRALNRHHLRQIRDYCK